MRVRAAVGVIVLLVVGVGCPDSTPTQDPGAPEPPTPMSEDQEGPAWREVEGFEHLTKPQERLDKAEAWLEAYPDGELLRVRLNKPIGKAWAQIRLAK